MRVIAGSAKGRKLFSVPGDTTRPVTDRVKGSLFNMLGADIEDAVFLDLFAGTGSVGIEALSRGAREVVFIDVARRAVETLRRNLELTGFSDRARVIHEDSFRFLKHAPADYEFDYIYVAPPQYQGLWAKALQALNERPMLAKDGLIIVQIHPKEFHELSTPRLRLVRERHYGSTALYFYALNEPSSESQDQDPC